MEDNYQEFVLKVKKARTKKTFKISGSTGMLKYYRYFNKHKTGNPRKNRDYILSFNEYSEIITRCNNKLCENLLMGKKTTLPLGLGTLYINKVKMEPKLDDNDNLIYKASIDWNTTLRYWYETPEAYAKRIIIRRDPGYLYKIHYVKGYYKNRRFFDFSPMRSLKIQLRDAIEKNNLDTLISAK